MQIKPKHSMCDLNADFHNLLLTILTILTEDKWNCQTKEFLNDNEQKHTDTTMTYDFSIRNEKERKEKD